ncbi:sigma-54-dependent transcriptional regulator [Granulosicoccus antarcticus]|uniref:C4-dicarboxylate transport transcriptional regulatory protein DctD n=1 Tax=Granulosicoccus antarcticus IMCC3135 TaxID=1192854 RepID=A0A2Z2NV50_9GAMM|nr:sigma-54 dependent transcriptional regulator [Granulosicoccus antarcticus]ASJ75123.1 C4-dicarboxylate transport transcriptional regulatory protein DctD [Granulosicoccus antarcticus IMCC3135]
MIMPLHDGQKAEGTVELEFNRLLRSAAILVVDDEPGMRNFLKRSLENRCALLEVAGSAEEAEALRLRYHFDLLMVDIRLPGLSGLEWMEKLRERGVRTHVIYMTAFADLDMAIAALRNGADDFIMKPFRTEQILLSMRRTLMRRQILRENSLLRLQVEQMQHDEGVVGESPAMRKVFALVQRVATTRTSVLIRGETGVGKALVAKSLHQLSRRSGAFISLNCGTLNEERIDSELFGHIKGAFAGAEQTRDGLIAHADKGTLFLDEIGRLPEPVQAKMLGVLERGVIRPVGSAREFPVDVRIIAATSCDLDELGASGAFRTDLFYRLNAMPLDVPPLRERGRDIELLVQHFMEQLASELRLAPVQLLHTDWEQLFAYHWPGNVRELRNLVERTLLLGELPLESLNKTLQESADVGPGYSLEWSLEQVERAHIEAVLASFDNNKSAAARRLGVSRKTLERKQALWYGATGK